MIWIYEHIWKFSSSFLFNFISEFLFHWGTNDEVLDILFILVKKSQKSIKNYRNDSHEKNPNQAYGSSAKSAEIITINK